MLIVMLPMGWSEGLSIYGTQLSYCQDLYSGDLLQVDEARDIGGEDVDKSHEQKDGKDTATQIDDFCLPLRSEGGHSWENIEFAQEFPHCSKKGHSLEYQL